MSKGLFAAAPIILAAASGSPAQAWASCDPVAIYETSYRILTDVVGMRLMQTGARLAHVINTALDDDYLVLN